MSSATKSDSVSVMIRNYLTWYNNLLILQKVPETAPAELTAVVDDLLNQLTTKFSAISADMIAKSKHSHLIPALSPC